jgi:hypothetical protein
VDAVARIYATTPTPGAKRTAHNFTPPAFAPPGIFTSGRPGVLASYYIEEYFKTYNFKTYNFKTYRSAWAEFSALYGYPLSPDRVPQPWNKGWSQNAATGPGDYPSLTTHLPVTSPFIPLEITARVR